MTNLEKEGKHGKSTPWIIFLVLIAALGVSYYQWNRYTTQNKIYTKVMKDYKSPIGRSVQKATLGMSKLQKAIQEFDLQNYDHSYNLFKNIKPKTDSVNWYLGHIALIKGQIYKSRKYSNKISDSFLKEDLLQYVNRIL